MKNNQTKELDSLRQRIADKAAKIKAKNKILKKEPILKTA